MKRFGTLVFYAVGAAAVAYLALYAYVMLTGRDLRPGAPIQIFRKPDAPSYSAIEPVPIRPFREVELMPSWPGLTRPSAIKDVDARHKAGHDAI